MRILEMPLKKEWYEMIERGEKPEEYREKKAYWIVRLYEWREGKRISMSAARVIESEGIDVFSRYIVPKHYDAVRFSYGYTKRRMLWEYRGLMVRQGRPEWGGPNYEVFIIKLGERL